MSYKKRDETKRNGKQMAGVLSRGKKELSFIMHRYTQSVCGARAGIVSFDYYQSEKIEAIHTTSRKRQ